MIVWGITDGSAGMVAQVKALASMLGVEPEMKTLTLPPPYVWLPNIFYTHPFSKRVAAFLIQKQVQGVAPKIVISCGRRGAAVAMVLKPLIPGAKFICIQDPRVDSGHFDLVVAMEHDRIQGANVIKTRYALHNITQQKLEQARAQFAPRFAEFPKPHVAVLLGGSTNKYTLSAAAMQKIVEQLRLLMESNNVSLLITPSRRTGEKNIEILQAAFAGNKRVYIYDFKEENPYVGLLALADYIVVSNDSVNMMSEAAATGKPLYILALAGHAGTKPANFAERLMADGIARPLGGALESWSYTPPDMSVLAREIKLRLAV